LGRAADRTPFFGSDPPGVGKYGFDRGRIFLEDPNRIENRRSRCCFFRFLPPRSPSGALPLIDKISARERCCCGVPPRLYKFTFSAEWYRRRRGREGEWVSRRSPEPPVSYCCAVAPLGAQTCQISETRTAAAIYLMKGGLGERSRERRSVCISCIYTPDEHSFATLDIETLDTAEIAKARVRALQLPTEKIKSEKWNTERTTREFKWGAAGRINDAKLTIVATLVLQMAIFRSKFQNHIFIRNNKKIVHKMTQHNLTRTCGITFLKKDQKKYNGT
jgi:hypothetical protein